MAYSVEKRKYSGKHGSAVKDIYSIEGEGFEKFESFEWVSP